MSFPEKKYFKILILLIVMSVLFFSVLFFSAYYSLLNLFKFGAVFFFAIGFFYFPLNEKIVSWFYSWSSPKIDKLVKNAKSANRGVEGENMVSSWLEEIVGKENFIKNVVLPNSKFDIDHLIIGSGGVVLLEVKNFTNPRRFENDEYYQDKEGGLVYISPEDDPRFKLRKYAYAVRKYFDNNGLESVSIKKALVFVNGKISWNGEVGTYIIKDKESLRNFISGLEVDSVCTPQICEKIKILLKK